MAPPRNPNPKSKKPKTPTPTAAAPSTPSSFAAALSTVAVARICLSAGYSAAEPAALRALSNVAARYAHHLAASAAAAAAAHGRTQTNALDLARAIDHVAAETHGFVGAADPTAPPLTSRALMEIAAFVWAADEVPFQPIPRPDDAAVGVGAVSFAAAGVEPPFRHVPSWLPCFPASKEMAEEEVAPPPASGGSGGLAGKLVAKNRERVRVSMTGKRIRAARVRSSDNEEEIK